MDINKKRSCCETAVAANAFLVALTGIATIVLTIIFSWLAGGICLAVLIYSAIELDRSVSYKKAMLESADIERPNDAILKSGTKKSIGASAFLMSAMVIEMIIAFVLLGWLLGAICLGIFIFAAIELSIAVSLLAEIEKGLPSNENTKTTLKSCIDRAIGANATLLACMIASLFLAIWTIIAVYEAMEMIFIDNILMVIIILAVLTYSAIRLSLADTEKKCFDKKAGLNDSTDEKQNDEAIEEDEVVLEEVIVPKKILHCPKCKGIMEVCEEEQTLNCPDCGAKYKNPYYNG